MANSVDSDQMQNSMRSFKWVPQHIFLWEIRKILICLYLSGMHFLPVMDSETEVSFYDLDLYFKVQWHFCHSTLIFSSISDLLLTYIHLTLHALPPKQDFRHCDIISIPWYTVFDLITAHTPISAQSRNSVVFRLQQVYVFSRYFFIKPYVVGTHLNCIDLLMQFKWVSTTYAFIKKIRKKIA